MIVPSKLKNASLANKNLSPGSHKSSKRLVRTFVFLNNFYTKTPGFQATSVQIFDPSNGAISDLETNPKGN